MFLKSLSFQERSLFIELAIKLANVDDNYSEEEEQLIEEFKLEAEMPNYLTIGIETDRIVERLQQSSAACQKIIYFECVTLANIDGYVADQEKELLEKLKKAFSITDEIDNFVSSWVKNEQETFVDLCMQVAGHQEKIIKALEI